MTRGTKRQTPSSATGGRFSIVFEDEDIVVIAKPAGLLTVPAPGRDSAPSVLELLRRCHARTGVRPFVVHRIDRETSGLVLFAKTAAAAEHLTRQFRGHTPERVYRALVHGGPRRDAGELVSAMRRDRRSLRQTVVRRGEHGATEARASFRTVERFRDASELEIRLDTGLKNQIRAQLADAGCPIIGDRRYGRKTPLDERIRRQALHAAKLTFVHPRDGESRSFELPMPQDMRVLRRYLKERQ